MGSVPVTILFAGDTHGDQRWLGRVVSRVRPSAIVHVGDIQLESPAEHSLRDVLALTRFLWVPGNHDFDSLDYYDRLQSPVLLPGALHGKVLEVDGLRLAGLGGWFQGRAWYPPLPPLGSPSLRRLRELDSDSRSLRLGSVRARGAIWWEDYQRLWDLRADVLVCHVAPSCHRHGFQAIDDLAQAMGVSRIYHGHHHQTYRAELPNGIEVFGVGLRAIVDLAGNVVHAGDGAGTPMPGPEGLQ